MLADIWSYIHTTTPKNVLRRNPVHPSDRSQATNQGRFVWRSSGNNRSQALQKSEASMAAQIPGIMTFVEMFTALGFFLSIHKSNLSLQDEQRYLGMRVNIPNKMFKVPNDKLATFSTLLNQIITQKEINIKTLQRLVGKAVSFSIAVPNSILFCREAYSLITQAEQKGKDSVSMNDILMEELSQFKFLELDWNGSSWRNPSHTAMKIFTDAAKLRWMGRVEAPEGVFKCGAELGPQFSDKHIHEKGAAGLLETIKSIPENILRNRWVEVFVDSQVLYTRRQ
eukprot:Lithocolla_globosa_v1_NODE_591_length_3661_cov_41.346644.p2 type:complete len:282 gc:universal NODE_591_length_3661_cov_41.346644:2226-3071(+)